MNKLHPDFAWPDVQDSMQEEIVGKQGRLDMGLSREEDAAAKKSKQGS